MIITLFISLLMSFNVLAQDEAADKAKNEKIYTQEDFNKEIERRVKRIANSGIAELSRELLKKERELSLKEIELKKKGEALEMTSKDLEKRLVEFQQEQKAFLGCINKNDQDKNKRVTHMVSVMSGMRPKNAADVLSVQDSAIAVKILGRLSPEKVSKIFNAMSKEISARLQKQYMSMKK